MKNFRIMPAMHMERQKMSGQRYALLVPNHPLGQKSDGRFIAAGDYIASWETQREAEIARYVLGIPERQIQHISVFVPDNTSFGWADRA